MGDYCSTKYTFFFVESYIALGASLVALLVNNPPVMQETSVRFLGQEDPLEQNMAIHCRILAWRIPMNRGAWQVIVHGVAKS